MTYVYNKSLYDSQDLSVKPIQNTSRSHTTSCSKLT